MDLYLINVVELQVKFPIKSMLFHVAFSDFCPHVVFGMLLPGNENVDFWKELEELLQCPAVVKWKSNNKLIRRQLRITARKQICAYAHIHTADVVLCYGAAFSRPVGCSNMEKMTTTSCAMDVSPWQASIIKL
ncbi:hypothetical protein T03_405 [Trichinella britovi]|uniref:Uncharacterized protein n=1 Tax=Trichinella britovi TaxID=45882 RepID=A0A0V1CUZ0_TRIBR|nr:hypothetical protein T09_7917 [Trichinella sp. T9]KRY52982.1 hypothetical protein T03_405 [Trichinella britovi]